MLVEASPLTMDDTVFSGNDVRATYATSEDVGIGGTTLEVDGGGTITNTRIAGNTAEAFSRDGVAAVSNGLSVLNFSDGPPRLLVVAEQHHRRQPCGRAQRDRLGADRGRGILNNSLLELRHVLVTRNSGAAYGPSGHAQGGGIWNGVELSGPPVELTLTDSAINHNSLTGSAAIALEGGGIFTTEPITRTRTSVTDNAPNQCTGC